MEIILRSNPNDGVGKNYYLLIASALLSVLLVISFSEIGDRNLPIVLISFLPIIFISLFNFRIIYGIIIISLFINLQFQWLSAAVWISSVIPISTFICFREIKNVDVQNPITTSLFVYFIAILISLANSIDLAFSLLLMVNMLAFIFIVYTSSFTLENKKEVIGFLILFLILNLLNSFQVITEGLLTSKRAFGFAGIMFVDFVGIAITMNFILLLTKQFKKFRFLLMISFIVLIAALLITQTRNAWLSTFLSLFTVLIFLVIKSKKFQIRKLFLIVIIIGSTVILSSVFTFISSVKPDITERAQETTKVEEGINKEGQIKNSLITRLLIWHTAYNAFTANPMFGIGAYSFPVGSQKYYTIPKFLYDDYVKGLTPHVTYLAVAVETGLIGLIAFLIFLFCSLKFAYDGLMYSRTNEENSFSLLIFWPLIYILISMFMTDAWLWGQGIVLWGIFLGINLWNRKKMIEKNSEINSTSKTGLQLV